MTPFYIGTQSNDPERGIYRGELDLHAGACAKPELVARSITPNFLARSECGGFLYAVGGDPVPGHEGGGSVTAYAITDDRGRLERLNQLSSQGRTPCHVALDKAGRLALVSNYGSGSLVAIPLDGKGRLTRDVQMIAYGGRGPHPARQEAAHLHSAVMDPENNFALALDLGTDRIYSYRVDHANGRLSPNEAMPYAPVAGGAGPRHFAFSRCGTFGYAVNELDNTIAVFRYDQRNGTLHPIQQISTLPPGYEGGSYASEIRVHPNGRFLYAANRGHNSIAVFGVNKDDGTLEPIQIESSGGDFPRHFNIDPSGRWMLVANERSDLIAGFEIDAASGRLRPKFTFSGIVKPSCIVFPGVSAG